MHDQMQTPVRLAELMVALSVATGMALFRFVTGKVAEVWVNVDMLGLLQQLGVVPQMG
jgi:hypothetical protein